MIKRYGGDYPFFWSGHKNKQTAIKTAEKVRRKGYKARLVPAPKYWKRPGLNWAVLITGKRKKR